MHGLGPLGGLAQLRRRPRLPASADGLPPRRRGLGPGRKQGIETVKQFAPILFGQVLVLNGRGGLAQTPLHTGAALGRIEGLDLGLALEQHLGEGPGIVQRLTQGRSPLLAQDVVRVLSAFQQGEAERPSRLQQGQGPLDGPVGGALAGPVPVETQHRLGRLSAPRMRRASGRPYRVDPL